MMDKKQSMGTTTLTLSIPKDIRPFFEELADHGYNRSFLMHKMTLVLEVLYSKRDTYPGGLHAAIDHLLLGAQAGLFPDPNLGATAEPE